MELSTRMETNERNIENFSHLDAKDPRYIQNKSKIEALKKYRDTLKTLKNEKIAGKIANEERKQLILNKSATHQNLIDMSKGRTGRNVRTCANTELSSLKR